MSRKRRRPPYHRRWHGDMLQGTRKLSLEQHGAYNRFLDTMYDMGGPLGLDEHALCNHLVCDPRVLKRLLADLIRLGKLRLWASDAGEVWVVNDRLLVELEIEDFSEDTSAELPAQVREKFGIAIQQLSKKSPRKPSKNKDGGSGEGPQSALPIPLPIPEPPIVPQGDGEPRLFELDASAPERADPIESAFAEWNDLARRYGLPVAEDLTEARRDKLKARMDKGGLARWRRALKAVEVSRFCRGMEPPRPGSKVPFRATLDFLLQPSTFQKLVEGNYRADVKPLAPVTPTRSSDDIWRDRVARFKAERYWRDADWGPRPAEAGCPAPEAILAEHGFTASILPFEPARASVK